MKQCKRMRTGPFEVALARISPRQSMHAVPFAVRNVDTGYLKQLENCSYFVFERYKRRLEGCTAAHLHVSVKVGRVKYLGQTAMTRRAIDCNKTIFLYG